MASKQRQRAAPPAAAPAADDPDLPAYVMLDEVVEVSGVERETLRRHLKRQGAIRRIGSERHYVDTSVLETAEGALYRRLLRRRLQRALASEGS